MQRVRLETMKGEFVMEVSVPPFQPAPDVILWGDRAFVPKHTPADPGDYTLRSEPWVYREGFMTVVFARPGQS